MKTSEETDKSVFKILGGVTLARSHLDNPLEIEKFCEDSSSNFYASLFRDEWCCQKSSAQKKFVAIRVWMKKGGLMQWNAMDIFENVQDPGGRTPCENDSWNHVKVRSLRSEYTSQGSHQRRLTRHFSSDMHWLL